MPDNRSKLPTRRRNMTDRQQSGGREVAINDQARPTADENEALDLRPVLQALFAKHGLHVAEAKQLKHGWQYRTYEGPVINIFNTGTVQLQGRCPELAGEFVKDLRSKIAEILHRRWLSKGHQGKRQ